MRHKQSSEKYEDLPERDWSEVDIRRLREQNIDRLYVSLSSVMHAQTLPGERKVELALDLLSREKVASRRARIWDSLGICARVTTEVSFNEAAELAWSLVDSFERNDLDDVELQSVLDFLSDASIFANANTVDLSKIRSSGNMASRYEIFRAVHGLCSDGDIALAGQISLYLGASEDFVLRESGINGISVIYTRADCDLDILGAFRSEFGDYLNAHEHDPHWYVRRAIDDAMFFQKHFDEE